MLTAGLPSTEENVIPRRVHQNARIGQFCARLRRTGLVKGKQPQRPVDLPEGWWLSLQDICRSQWGESKTRLDIYVFLKISRRALGYARSKNKMTEQLFARVTEAVGYENHKDLLNALGQKNQPSRLATPVPKTLSLTTQKSNPQWADYDVYLVEAPRPWALRCRIATGSPYFRFGFKLLGEGGRVFGDASINSYDANMVVHIGRNNYDRPALKITAQDIFLTAYMSGSYIDENDQFLFSSGLKLEVPIELAVDRNYCASLSVNGQSCFRQVVPPPVCRRVAVYAWGDREEFRVDVTDLAIMSI